MLALFVSLGGGAYAALKVPRGSVGTAQLRAGAVTKAKLRQGAVTSRKVKDGSLLARDFRAGQLPAGPQGPPGEPGPRGPSDAYDAETGGGSPVAIPLEAGFVTVQSLPVPAGSYLMLAKLGLHNVGSYGALVLCRFPGGLDENSAVVPAQSSTFGAGSGEITLQHAETFTSPTTISVECSASGTGGEITTSFDKLTALAVDALH